MRNTSAGLITLLMAALPTMGSGQAWSVPIDASLVRACTGTGRCSQGRILFWDSQSITIRNAGQTDVLKVSEFDTITFGQRKTSIAAGAGIGLMVGVALGAAIGSTQEFCVFSCTPATGLGAMMGAPVGLLLGVVLGAIPHTKWGRQVPIPIQVTLSPGRLGLNSSLRF